MGPSRHNSALRRVTRIALVSLVVYATWALVREYWERQATDGDIARAYEFVINHGEVTSYLPCFCGCEKRQGHSSFDSCFVSRRDELGRMVSRDAHAET